MCSITQTNPYGYTPAFGGCSPAFSGPTISAPQSFRPGDLNGQSNLMSSPYASNLTNSQGFAARSAMGNRGNEDFVGGASDGVATADHVARSVDSASRATRATRATSTVARTARAARTGVAGASALEAGTGLSKGLRVADGILGPLGIVAGGVGIAQGAVEMSKGKVVEGGLDIVGGSAGMVSGTAATVTAAAGAAAPAAAAALAAGGAGVAAAADGIKDIYQGVKESNTEKVAVGGVKTVAGGLLIGGAATANPIAIGAGAVLYGGAVVYENREAIGNAAKAVGRGIANGASAVGNGIANGAKAVGNGISSAWNSVFG